MLTIPAGAHAGDVAVGVVGDLVYIGVGAGDEAVGVVIARCSSDAVYGLSCSVAVLAGIRVVVCAGRASALASWDCACVSTLMGRSQC